MSKNGTFFIALVEQRQLNPSVWDPHSYRWNDSNSRIGDFVSAGRAKSIKGLTAASPFAPLEYAHIPKGRYLSYILEPVAGDDTSKWPLVAEEQLLFGTMRAYLGNAVITPRAEWLGLESPLYFRVKSEFVHVKPYDGLHYFWWAYLRSRTFLRNLPIGGGGTRPRLNADGLLQTPSQVPNVDAREAINRKLLECARLEWTEYTARMKVLTDLDQLCPPG